MKQEIKCECGCLDHIIEFTKDEDTIYISMFANPYGNIFRRIKAAILYVFNVSKVEYDCVVVSKKDFIKTINKLKL